MLLHVLTDKDAVTETRWYNHHIRCGDNASTI